MTAVTAVLRRLIGGGKIGAVIRIIGYRSLTLAINLTTGLMGAALLGAHGRGELAALLVAPQMLGYVALLGLPTALVFNIKVEPEKERAYLGWALIFALPAALVVAATAYAILPVWLGHLGEQTVANAQLLVMTVPLGALVWVFNAVLEARGQFGLVNGVVCLQSAATLLMLAVFSGMGLLSPFSAAVAYVLPSVPALGYFAVRVCYLVRPRIELGSRIPQRLLAYGFRHYGIDLLSVLSAHLDRLAVVLLLAPQAMGVYTVALSISRVLLVVQSSVWTVLFPSIVGLPIATAVSTVGTVFRIMITLNLAAALVLSLAGPQALLFFGAEFSAAITPLRILLAETAIYGGARILYQAYTSTGRPGTVPAFEGVGVLVSAAGMVLLVPTYGASGAACAVLAGSVTRLYCALAAFGPVLGVAMPRLMMNRADVNWAQERL